MLRSTLIFLLLLWPFIGVAAPAEKTSTFATSGDLEPFKNPSASCHWKIDVKDEKGKPYTIESCSDYVVLKPIELEALRMYCLKRSKAVSPDEEKYARNRYSKWTPKKACDTKQALFGCYLQNDKVTVISWSYPTPNVTSKHVEIMKKDPAIAAALLCDASKKRSENSVIKIVAKESVK